MAGLDLGGVGIKGCLRGGVFGEEVCEGGEVVEEVGVVEVASFEVREEGGEAGGDGGGEEEGAIRGRLEEVEESGEEEPGGLFFRGEPEELGVEGDDVLFSVREGREIGVSKRVYMRFGVESLLFEAFADEGAFET